jgi:hypothetical protein
MGYLPTGAVAATGWGRGRSAAIAVPTKAREATPKIMDFNIEVSRCTRLEFANPDRVNLMLATRAMNGRAQ